MSASSVLRRDRNKLRKWFGTNRGTHWTIAGSVSVIIFGSYLIYNSRDSGPTTSATLGVTGQTPVPTPPGSLTLQK